MANKLDGPPFSEAKSVFYMRWLRTFCIWEKLGDGASAVLLFFGNISLRLCVSDILCLLGGFTRDWVVFAIWTSLSV